MYRHRLVGAVFLLLLLGESAGAQATLRTAAGPYVVNGTVIIPGAMSLESLEVVLRDLTREIERLRVIPGLPFTIGGLKTGTYELAVEVPGFKPVHRQVELLSIIKETDVTIVLEPEVEQVRIVERSPLSVEDADVVDVTALAGFPNSLLKEFGNAQNELRERRFQQAQERLESVVREAPDFFDGHTALGTAYQKLCRYDDAEREFLRARELRPDSPAPLIYLGSLYLQQAQSGDSSKFLMAAENRLQQATELNPNAAFAYYLLGIAKYRNGQALASLNDLHNALELEPQFGQVRLAMANVFIRLKDWRKAIEQLDLYLKGWPDASDHESVAATRSRIETLLNSAG